MLHTDDQNEILMGSANIIIRFNIFKFYFCSFGPTFSSVVSSSVSINDFLKRFSIRSADLRCFATQISVPAEYTDIPELLGYRKGAIFNSITSYRYSNLIILRGKDGNHLSEEELIKGFTPNGRRDVRLSLRKQLHSKTAITYSELFEAYECIELNGKIKGYEVRKWQDIGKSLVESVGSNMCYVLTAFHNGVIQGACILEVSANTLNYTMGGVTRSTPDLLTGYFLQIEAIKLAKKLQMDYYNISYGGPSSVQKFKSQFNPTLIEAGVVYHKINNKLLYRVFKILYSSKFSTIILKILKGISR